MDQGNHIVVDAVGNAYVAGTTLLANFPATPGAFQPASKGWDAFVTKLNPTGTALIYSTFLGGIGIDEGTSLTVDSAGNAYVVGRTGSTDFPTTPSAFQTVNAGGDDAFVTKLNAAGAALIYSTYVGGLKDEQAFGVAVDSKGNAYITGSTASSDFPTKNPLQGKFPRYPGRLRREIRPGSLQDNGFGIAVDSAGRAYVTGGTTSTDFPITPVTLDGTCNAGCTDSFIAVLNGTGSALDFSSFLGGDTDEQRKRCINDQQHHGEWGFRPDQHLHQQRGGRG